MNQGLLLNVHDVAGLNAGVAVLQQVAELVLARSHGCGEVEGARSRAVDVLPPDAVPVIGADPISPSGDCDQTITTIAFQC